MKKVNFIVSLPPYKQHEIRRWFWCTAVLWVISFGMGAYFVVPQLMNYVYLKKEVCVLREKTKSYDGNLKNKDALKNEHTSLFAHTNKIKKYTDQPKNPHQHIQALFEAAGDGVKIESLKINKKDVECTVLCPTSEHATVFIKRLSASDLFTTIKLVSLQHDTHAQQMRAVIKGNVVFL